MHKEAVHRLERYLAYLTEIKAYGRATVTSEELGKVIDLSSSRVRQDFIQLKVIGKPRSGYNVNDLETIIYSELNLLEEKGMALVGYGNLGRALVRSGIWCHAGFALRAIYDIDRSLVGQTVGDLVIRHTSEMYGSIKTEGIESACLTVPAAAAQNVARMLASAGIRGIWNFAPVDLRVPPRVIVENQRMEQGLMTLSYLLKSRSERKSDSDGDTEKNSSDSPNDRAPQEGGA